MIVSCCGFGSTGSSVVSDYLMECENVQSFDPFEFNLVTMTDGLEDLESHLMGRHTRLFSSADAFYRFEEAVKMYLHYWSVTTGVPEKIIYDRTTKYLNSISQLDFIGDTSLKDHSSFIRSKFGVSIIKQRIIPYLERKRFIKKNINFYPLDEVRVAVNPDNFYNESKDYIRDILTLMGCDFSKIVALDQAFSGNDPAKSFPFFDDPYAIVVDRDPRDQYIFTKKFLLSRGRYMPTDDVYDFIKYYRLLRDNQPYKIPNDRILLIRFEEMVYDHGNATNKINNFLNITNKKQKTIFNPTLSAANTNLITKFPEFSRDIQIIEKEIPEYLFHFENYNKIDNGGQMFCGKSPLNKQ